VFLNRFANAFYATTKRQRDGAGPNFRPTLRVATRDLGEAVQTQASLPSNRTFPRPRNASRASSGKGPPPMRELPS
jgi:hypothetical protein